MSAAKLTDAKSWLYGINPRTLVNGDARDRVLEHLIRQATKDMGDDGYALHEWKLHSRPSFGPDGAEITFEAIGVKKP